MKDGFLKAAALSPALRVADCAYNAGRIVEAMRECAARQVKLAVFPELALTGYTCGDLFFQQALQQAALRGLGQVLEASREWDLLALVGLPLAVNGKLYNCAAAVCRGRLLGLVPKTCLPNYGEFYEKRHFAPGDKRVRTVTVCGQQAPFGTQLLFRCRQMPEFVLGVELCEDLWSALPPSTFHALAGATVIANLSASDETVGKAEYRRALVANQSARLLCGYLYASAGHGESTQDMVFAGHDLVAENGVILAETQPFQGGDAVSELDCARMQAERARNTSFIPNDEGYQVAEFDLAVTETPLTRRVVPKQGMVTASTSEAGRPSWRMARADTSRARQLSSPPEMPITAVWAWVCSIREVNITATVRSHFADIGHDGQTPDVTFENSQARVRTLELMDIANLNGGFVVGTGDLSELALGWATYNGDHMSMYGVNAGVPKTLVRHLVRYEADTASSEALRRVLLDILDTPVSPELLPAKDGEIAQRTEELVGPYELHDFYLYYVLRFGFGPRKIFRLARAAFAGSPAYTDEVLARWLRSFYRRFFAQQFKRSCLPDGPKVGSVTLSPRGDWRMPSDASAAAWLAELDTLPIQ